MKKFLTILFLFFLLNISAQTPQAPIIFTSIGQMQTYAGSYFQAMVTDTATGGWFTKKASHATPDSIRIFIAADTNYRWFKIANYQLFKLSLTGLNGQVPYFTIDDSTEQLAGDILNIGKFIYTDAQLDSMKESKAAQIDIFNRWRRFAHGGTSGVGNGFVAQNTDTIPIRTDATNSFSYDPSTNLINSTYNTGAYIGFVSTHILKSYTISGTLSAINNDNDKIGMVIAYIEDRDNLVRNNAFGLDPNDFTWNINTTDSLIPTQHTLAVYRLRSSTPQQYMVRYDDGLPTNKTIYNGTSLLTYTPTTNWNSDTTEVDLKVVRQGDTIRIFTTEYADAPGGKGALGHEIDILLSSDSVLYKFRKGSYFGITSQSQALAYWKNFSFSDNTLNIYDLRNGDVWMYDGNNYVLDPTQSTFIDVGIRRLWYNPYLQTSGYINSDSSYYVTNKATNYTTAALDFPNTLANSFSDTTVVIGDAAVGDIVNLVVAPAAILANSSYTAWVNSVNMVTIRFNNFSASAQNPPLASFSIYTKTP